MQSIIKRQAYAFVGSKHIYRTSYSAARALAWQMIAEKHSEIMGAGTINHMGYTCDCDEDSTYGSGQECCMLHNRKNGYFKRLSVKLIKIILLRYAND